MNIDIADIVNFGKVDICARDAPTKRELILGLNNVGTEI